MTHVGLRVLDLSDPSRSALRARGRDRPLRTYLWYPTGSPPEYVEWSPLFAPAHVSMGAPPAGYGLPAVLLSHGTGGSAWQLNWLAEALATAGYAVIGVDHHGNNARDPYLPEAFARVWDRPRDLSAALDAVLEGDLVDPDRVGVAGFSMGGYTAAALVGARVDPGRYTDLLAGHASLPPPPEFPDLPQALRDTVSQTELSAWVNESAQPVDDPRVRSAFLMAPALGPLLDGASLARIGVPVWVLYGEADTNTPPAANAHRFAALIPLVEARALPAVGHYAFLAAATAAGRAQLPEICADPPGVDRPAVHRSAAADAVSFFARTLQPVRLV